MNCTMKAVFRLKVRKFDIFVLPILVLILIFSLDANAEGTEQEIPKQAGGAFREFMKKIGGELNYNEQLYRDYFSEDEGFRATIFPFGRSLERLFADLENPRVLVNLDTSNNGYVHISFTPLNNQLQIISSNDSGRGNGGYNDFIIVDDFALSRKPRIKYAEVGLCTACHQSGNLIFPRGISWSESRPEIYKKSNSFWLKEGKRPHPIAVNLASSSLQVWSYDRVLRVQAERFVPRQQIRNACPDNLDCRSEILIAALSKNYDMNRLQKFFLQENNRVKSFHIASDLLSTRDESIENVQEKYQFPFSIGEDPLFPRLSNNSGAANLDIRFVRELAIPNDVKFTRNYNLSDSQIRHLFSNRKVQQFLKTRWPMQRSEVNYLVSLYEQDSQLSTLPYLNTESEIRQSLNNAEAVYNKYCISCHDPAGGPATAISFSEVDQFVGLANKHRNSFNLVNLRIMPPAESPQMSESERVILLRYLQEKK